MNALMLLLIALSAGQVVETAADKPAAEASGTPDGRQRLRLREQLDASVAWNEISPSVDDTTLMQPVPVHRWTNDDRDPQGQALGVLWTHAGRPVAAASIFPWNGRLMHELDSLSRGTFVCRREGEVVWAPRAGISYQPVPDAEPPAEGAAARLRQMKAIADRFTVTMLGWKSDDSDREELRRFSKEWFRYRPEADDLLDGAVFAFVKGTDPEALLVVEAVRGRAGFEWQYAFVRQTSGAVEARLGEQSVWRVEKHVPRKDPSQPYISLSGPLEPDPAPESAIP